MKASPQRKGWDRLLQGLDLSHGLAVDIPPQATLAVTLFGKRSWDGNIGLVLKDQKLQNHSQAKLKSCLYWDSSIPAPPTAVC